MLQAIVRATSFVSKLRTWRRCGNCTPGRRFWRKCESMVIGHAACLLQLRRYLKCFRRHRQQWPRRETEAERQCPGTRPPTPTSERSAVDRFVQTIDGLQPSSGRASRWPASRRCCSWWRAVACHPSTGDMRRLETRSISSPTGNTQAMSRARILVAHHRRTEPWWTNGRRLRRVARTATCRRGGGR